MDLVDWLLAKLNLETVSSALFRIGAGIMGWTVFTASWSATPLHLAADLTRNCGAKVAHQLLSGADTWLGQEVERRQILGFAAVIVLAVGAHLAVQYRVSAIDNLGISAMWLGAAALREAGCPGWLMLTTLPVVVVLAVLFQSVRFGNRYHRVRDRFGYGFIHVGGSLIDPLALVVTLLRRGPSCLGWQWIVINPRAEFWRRIDLTAHSDRAESQPHESLFVMFGPPAIADWVREDPQLSRYEVWRAIPRQPDVEWGLSKSS